MEKDLKLIYFIFHRDSQQNAALFDVCMSNLCMIYTLHKVSNIPTKLCHLAETETIMHSDLRFKDTKLLNLIFFIEYSQA